MNTTFKKRIWIPLLMTTVWFQAGILSPSVRSVERSLPQFRYEYARDFIKKSNPAVSATEIEAILDAVLFAAPEIPVGLKIDGKPMDSFDLLLAFIFTESTFKREVVSFAGACGYMQVMPATLAWMNDQWGGKLTREDLFRTDVNIRWGTRYLALLLTEFKSPRLAALAYNAGPFNLRRGLYSESYWQKILRSYRLLQKGKPATT
ncbi:MAG: lytic transglycosylase domain-containing protein [Spirochaetales bacterium]|nr:lytic transglycosylase domain-containing protein [Spirochaetales bacterium]